MKKILLFSMLLLFASSASAEGPANGVTPAPQAPAIAAPPPPAPTPVLKSNAQQTRMKTCNAAAAGKKGEERKAFMKNCLSGEETTEATSGKKLSASQERMKTCNATAKEKKLKGAERKTFLSACLKGEK